MRLSSCILLAFVWTCTVHGQPTFQRLYQSATSYTFDLNELPSGKIFTCMAATHLLSPQGHIEHSGYYHSGGTNMTQTLKAVSANCFYFTTSTLPVSCPWGVSGNLNLVHPVIGKMDSLGNTQVVRKYELNTGICRGTPGGLEVTADKGVLTWGREHNFYLMRTDSTLAPIWSKRIGNSGGVQFIKELPGGDLLAGMNMDTEGAVVARMDAHGQFLWCKSYIRPKGMVHDAVIESDDSFIITGYTDSTNINMLTPLPTTFQPKLFMMKLNGAGEIQWCRGYNSAPNLWYTPRPSKIVKTLDGNYALLATLGYPQNNSFFRPYLMKTDLNADTLWTRSVGANGYDHYTMDLLAYSDGGYMFSGGVWGDMPGLNSSLKYIYKTDSTGHFSCMEKQHAIEVLELFPTDSSFVLASMDGVTSVYPILVTDSILDPNLFSEYDGCIITTAPHHPPTRKPRLYPNPNTGRFTVQFEDPLLAESYYSVYDTTGKLLLQRPLPTGATVQEVDLSRFGAGTYVIKFTTPDGVCHERVQCSP